jgi:hypothetical protein
MKKCGFLVVLLLLFIIDCSARKRISVEDRFGAARPIGRVVNAHNPGEVSFVEVVKPILDRRCGVCHSCYDAPCQLKLTSFEGLDRGGSKEPVYNSSRLTAMSPTRLFQDAHTTSEWRKKGFHPVLNERDQKPGVNLENSVVNLMLELKQDHPQPRTTLLPADFDISLGKEPICATAETFDKYKKKYPLWGMPYALPELLEADHKTIVKWLAEGAHVTPTPPLSPSSKATVEKWERFLNGDGLKNKLMSRYIYEHLFIGHIHFEDHPDREFFRLVRSRTGPGTPVDEISTVRPYDDPLTKQFYYRFRKIEATIAEKNHTVYRMSDQVMARYDELFLNDTFEVDSLPSYDPKTTGNPFKTFEALPAKSRYQFMLDNARFFIMGFIKGPVCRGQVALNVINDHFFVAFFDPEKDTISNDSEFLSRVSDDLTLPSVKKSSLNVLSLWTDFKKRQMRYLEAKEKYLMALHPDNKVFPWITRCEASTANLHSDQIISII